MEDPVADMPNTESPRRISPCARDTASIPVPVRLGKHLRMGDTYGELSGAAPRMGDFHGGNDGKVMARGR